MPIFKSLFGRRRADSSSLIQDYYSLYELTTGTPISPRHLGINQDFTRKLNTLLQAQTIAPKGISSKFVIGVFPTKTFNARALKVENGHILLVNHGLMDFAFQMAGLVAGLIDAESKGTIASKEIEIERASELFGKSVTALLRDSIPSEIDFFPQGARQNLALFLFQSLMDFVIAHELSHILCGHLDDKEPIKLQKYTAKDVDYYYHSWQEEFEADRVAMVLTKRINRGRIREELIYQGPVLFFEIVEAISDAASGFPFPLGLTSHPAAAARRSNIIFATRSDGILAGYALQEVNGIVAVVEQLRNPQSERKTDAKREHAEQLRQYVDRYDEMAELGAMLDGLLKSGQDVEGLTEFEYEEIVRFLKQDHNRAQAAIATVALGLIKMPKATNWVFGLHLAILTTLYLEIYGNTPSFNRAADDFFKLLSICVDDLGKYMAYHRQITSEQLSLQATPTKMPKSE